MPVAVEGLARALAYDRGAFEAGEWWRLATGLASHWSVAHLVANATALVILGGLVARREGPRVLWWVGAGAVVIQVAALAWISDAAQYRGSSGIAWALAVFALLRVLEGHALAQAVAAGATLIVAVFAPALMGASTLLPAGVSPDPVMHAAGVLVACAAATTLKATASIRCCASRTPPDPRAARPPPATPGRRGDGPSRRSARPAG